MGANNSGNICRHCATEVIPPPPVAQKPKLRSKSLNDIESASQTAVCDRCHGPPSSINLSINKGYIEHLHIAPFHDTLQKHANEEKEIDSDYIINRYLKPYFTQHSNTLIKIKHRLLIKSVEFKVFGCYPPIGYVNPQFTKFHLNGDNGKLLKLKFKPIKKIYFLPIKKSVNTFQKYNKDMFSQTAMNDISNKYLLTVSLKPYLKGSDSKFYIAHESNESEDNSRFYLSDKTLFGDADDSGTETEEKKEKITDTKCDQRHLMEQETFIANSVLWRVMKCVPSNGFIDANTQMFCQGIAITDLDKISIRPIYEQLPHAHRNFTPTQIKRHYLDPFFKGKSRFIGFKKQVEIFGVHFTIRESKPSEGIVTMSTKIDHMGTAIRMKELENIHVMEDEEMAQKMQKEMMEESNKRRREARESALQQWNDPLGFEFGFNFPWNRPQQPPPKKNDGLSKEIVSRLPIFTFTNNNRDDQCRVCLEGYIEGDTLRILPCFHFYHKECVDTWLLKMSSRCPICKTSIIKLKQQRNR